MSSSPGISLETTDPSAEKSRPFFLFSIGTLECVALSDGYVEGPVRPSAPDVPEEELTSFLAAEGEDTVRRRTLISCLFVRDGAGSGMLVDAGLGTLPGPAGTPILTAGRLQQALAAAGIDPGAIATILVSHIHPDHIGGLFDDADRPFFPAARYHVPQEEIDFWGQPQPDLGGTTMPPGMRVESVKAAHRFLTLAKDRIVPFPAGGEAIDGVGTILLDGHTPGQVGFLFDGGSDTLFYTSDAAGNRTVSIKRPHWRFSFDTDAERAIATRRRLIELLVETGWSMFTPHFPWPPVGKMERHDGETSWRQTV